MNSLVGYDYPPLDTKVYSAEFEGGLRCSQNVPIEKQNVTVRIAPGTE